MIKSLSAIATLLLVSATPVAAQSTSHGDVVGRCYAIAVRFAGDTFQRYPLMVRFDSTTQVVGGERWRSLRLLNAVDRLGPRRGWWRDAPGDSVSIRLAYIDTGSLFTVGGQSSDTLRGAMHNTGVWMRDTLTKYSARVIRQPTCSGS